MTEVKTTVPVSGRLCRRALLCLAFLLARPAFSEEPSDRLARLGATLFEEPLVATAPTTPKEDADRLEALGRYQDRGRIDDYTALEGFLSAHPSSGWQAALLTNLGLSHYRDGRFSLAIDGWEMAWRAGKDAAEPRAKALADRAVGELMRMHARLGYADRQEALFAEMGDRAVSGPATESVTGAREGLWAMRNNPGIAYLCGPMALKNLLLSQGASPKRVGFLSEVRSPPDGISLAEVGRLADRAKLPHTLIRREPGSAIPVPSVVHWKVSHYAAIVGEDQGRYHVRDPIFGEDLWVGREAIDGEASGYFLVEGRKLQPGWHTVALAEAEGPHGMGYTGSILAGNTTTHDDTAQPRQCNRGMCGYTFTEMVVSLNLADTPVGYQPPIGPAVYATLTYNQREASQPANFSFFNVSQKWSLNWLGYIQDTPGQPGANVSRYEAGGGGTSYGGYNPATGQFAPEAYDQSVLALVSSSPVRYERRLPDGSVESYAQSSGDTNPRRVFMTQRTDPQGNAVTLHYDSYNGQPRLATVTDAIGRDTAFAYGQPGQPLLVTRITDPFGRSASLAYDASGRLASITDALGLQSSFHYDSASLIDRMATPYGTTTFAYGGDGTSRWLQATDPLGHTERLEFQQQAPGIPFSDPAATVPQGIVAPFNVYLNGRDTFYWDASTPTSRPTNREGWTTPRRGSSTGRTGRRTPTSPARRWRASNTRWKTASGSTTPASPAPAWAQVFRRGAGWSERPVSRNDEGLGGHGKPI